MAFLLHFGSFGGLFYYFLNILWLNCKRLIVWEAFLYFSHTILLKTIEPNKTTTSAQNQHLVYKRQINQQVGP